MVKRLVLVAFMVFAGIGLIKLQAIKVKAQRLPQALVITSPNGTEEALPEMDEFATMVMGDAWDMSQPSDTALYRPYDSAFSQADYANGHFVATLQYGDGRERIALLYAGALDNQAMRIGKTGYTYPINADKYRYLTFRLHTNVSGCYSGLVRWHASDARLDDTQMGISNSVAPVPANCSSGWHIYTVDLKTIGIQVGQLNWGGTIRELQLIPIGGSSSLAGQQIKVDWARLTAADPRTSRPFSITWTGVDSGYFSLYASPGDKILDDDDIQLSSGVNGADGAYTWQTGVVPPGEYYIYMTNGSQSAWSDAPVVINQPPILNISRPSYTSGEDYAASVIGNPWDMSDEADLDLTPPWFTTWLDQTEFSGGIFNARTLCCPSNLSHSDPVLFLGGMDLNPPGTSDPGIDTAKYHYLSFRFYMEGEQDIPNGWVARFYWWRMNDADSGVLEQPTTGRDILLYEGWNTYNLDLWAADARDETDTTHLVWADASPTRYRFDPNELLPHLAPGYIHLDWIKLNATDAVTQGQVLPVQYTGNKMPLTVTGYYDTDTDSTNGRTAIQVETVTPPSPVSGIYKIYIPLITNNYAGGFGQIIRWDTAGVPAGTYWVSLDADDGSNVTTWYSQAPVVVQP